MLFVAFSGGNSTASHSFGSVFRISVRVRATKENDMATTKAKKGIKKSEGLKRAKRLDSVKPLSKTSTPVPVPKETITLPYGSTKFEY
jgi:hypothetical protein